MARCHFCKEYNNLHFLSGSRRSRKIYEDDVCQALLEIEQSVVGYTFIIPKNHYETIMDSTIPDDVLCHIWRVTQRVGNAIKVSLGAENIYIASMCDGIKHLHIHMIPRYKWTDADKNRYRELFLERDGEESVKLCTGLDMIGGYWYLSDKETNYKKTEFWKLPFEQREIYLHNLAQRIRLAL